MITCYFGVFKPLKQQIITKKSRGKNICQQFIFEGYNYIYTP